MICRSLQIQSASRCRWEWVSGALSGLEAFPGITSGSRSPRQSTASPIQTRQPVIYLSFYFQYFILFPHHFLFLGKQTISIFRSFVQNICQSDFRKGRLPYTQLGHVTNTHRSWRSSWGHRHEDKVAPYATGSLTLCDLLFSLHWTPANAKWTQTIFYQNLTSLLVLGWRECAFQFRRHCRLWPLGHQQ